MPHKINEILCVQCGLCITKCPDNAITGENPTRVSTSLVYGSVRIDPELCTDCETCLSEEYWCPAEAIVKE